MPEETPDRPIVSVIMAAYNEERYVAAAVESILAQTLPDFELILIDDASHDGTGRILRDLAAGDARVRLVRNEANRGLTASLNVGLRLARGRYIARMDADDFSLPERLERQVAFLDRHPDYVLVGTGHRIIDTGGNVLRTEVEGTEPWEFAWMSLFRPPLMHSSAMFRAAPVRDQGVTYDESCRTAQDFDLWSRLLDHGKALVLPEPLLLYRIHPANVSARRGREQADTARAIAARHLYRRYPELVPEDRAVGSLLDLLFDCRRLEAADVGRAVRAMDRIVGVFRRHWGLPAAATRRQRLLAARWLALAARRSGIARQPLVLARFTWAVRGYWFGIVKEFVRYGVRRLAVR